MEITNTTNKDSEASAFIEQKDVILCRSGIQLYRHCEVEATMTETNRPPVIKDFYREYRPANVVVKALDKCRSLPVTKEHPDEWVTPHNFSSLVGGTTDKEVTVVALEGESEGEIGLKSNITFYTDSLYDYYQGNKEVSLGYTCKKHWVSNPEEVGYDVILDEITEVNHLAITMAGRGGSSVAVIDSKIGGLKSMKTGIFAWLSSLKQKDTTTDKSFGEKVVDTLRMEKEEEMNKAFDSVLDSCGEMKDSEAKTLLVNAVSDCFGNKEKAINNATEMAGILDSLYAKAKEESLSAIADACSEKPEDENGEEKAEDSEEKSDEDKAKDSDEKEDEKSDENKDSEEEKEGEKSENKDSSFNKDSLIAEIRDSIKDIVAEEVKAVLGLNKDTKTTVNGMALDKVKDSVVVNTRDYLSLLD